MTAVPALICNLMEDLILYLSAELHHILDP